MGKFKFKYSIRANFMLKTLFVIVIFTLIIPLTSCSPVIKLPVESEVSMDRTTFSFSQGEQPFDLFPEYRIVPGDILDVLFQIRTWVKKENFRIAVDHDLQVKFIYAPELDISQKVRPDGNITLPYIGDVYVIGKTVQELTNELKDLYKDILNIPALYVEVPEFRASIKELKADLHTAPRGLSRLVTVRPDGYVTFPMVGDVFVAAKTIPEVNKVLNEMYEKILPDLHCDLFLERHAGSVIYIVGQVKKPGAYTIARPVTILEALSFAEGDIPGAKLNSIIIIRKHEQKMVATRVDLKNTLAFNSDSKFFYLQPNDIVYVPKTWITEAAEVARDIGDIIFFRGWSVGFSWELHNEPYHYTP
jgi:polysaccharide export outer membrane protein